MRNDLSPNLVDPKIIHLEGNNSVAKHSQLERKSAISGLQANDEITEIQFQRALNSLTQATIFDRNRVILGRLLQLQTVPRNPKPTIDTVAFDAAVASLQARATFPDAAIPIHTLVDWTVHCATSTQAAVYSPKGQLPSEPLAVDLIARRLQQVQMSELFPMMTQVAEGRKARSLLTKCYWTGTQCPRESVGEIVPCKFVDCRNFAVSCFDRPICQLFNTVQALNNSGFQGLTLNGCISETQHSQPSSSKNVTTISQGFRELDPVPTVVGISETSRCWAACPRISMRGRLARLILYLYDKYGKDAVPIEFIPDNLLLTWVVSEPTEEEIVHELFMVHMLGDVNPLVFMPPILRSRYATNIIRRPAAEQRKVPTQLLLTTDFQFVQRTKRTVYVFVNNKTNKLVTASPAAVSRSKPLQQALHVSSTFGGSACCDYNPKGKKTQPVLNDFTLP